MVVDFIYKRYDVVCSYIPEQVIPLDRGFGQSCGLCSHPDLANESWIHSQGGKRFEKDTTLPDDFFWMGIQYRGGSEYFFMMWYKNHRRFWFYDQHAVYVAITNQSPEQTLKRINMALEKWMSTNGDVINCFF